MSTSPLYAAYKTDKNLEKDGITLDFGFVERDGKQVPMRITIARAGGSNTRFDKVFEVKTKPYKRMIQADALDTELGRKIMRETYAETVILGWENIPDSAGKFLDFTQENVIQVMTDLPDLFGDITISANKASLFRAEILEADAKN